MCKHVKLKINRPLLFKWVGRCLFVSILLAQVSLLNQYLVSYENNSSFQAFTLAYVPAMLLWAKGQMNYRQREVAAGVWFLYIVPLCIHSGWILGALMPKIDVDSPGLDHGFVKYPLSAAVLVYMMLDADEFEPKLHIKLNWPVIVDIFDIVNLLDAVIDPRKNEAIPNDIHYCICAFGVVSLVVLTFSFAIPIREALKNTDETNKTQVKMYTVYILVQAIVVNLPFLVIRLVLHYTYKSGASVFAFKNLFVIVINFIEVNFDCCASNKEHEQPATSNGQLNGHTPSNTEESGSMIQSSRMDDVSSIASSTRRSNKDERPARPQSRVVHDITEDPEEIIVLS
ncbi:Cat eye syndrome [Desmophyllum pertusum]|uniref:Cat eye syndrome n=1 Tax=Desmophyllum pertusum TaxID=174260 RepID=A0A9X0CVP8_9CNID|nr:Cat eye syndrome [Desmophyllum pertusum]